MNIFRRLREALRRLRERPPVSLPPPDDRDFKEWDSTCPNCHQRNWIEGPHGGMSINLKCGDCGIWINAVPALGIYQRIRKGERA